MLPSESLHGVSCVETGRCTPLSKKPQNRRRPGPNVRTLLFLFSILSVAGCLGEDVPFSDESPPLVSEPVQINSIGAGYEPSIRVGPDGTLYVTAHKQEVAAEGTRLASWLWYSMDDGSTWIEMPSPLQMHSNLWALEGDLAIDDAGAIYYVDTYLADQTFSRWRTAQGGPVWESTRPIAGTVSLDDRPWLEAHGDGIVYLMVNHGPDMPTPNSLAAGTSPTDGGDRMWIFTSQDGGETWNTGHGFSGSWWCGLAASKVDDQTVYAGCFTPGWLPGNIRQNYLGEDVTFEVHFHTSTDRGVTWTHEHIADYETRNGLLYPQPAADLGGNVYHTWFDDDTGDAVPTRLMFATVHEDWRVTDITPFNGSLQRIWTTAGAPGHVAITFYGSADHPTVGTTEWVPYLYESRNADAERPTWTLTALDGPVATGDAAPADFFQNAIGPDGRVHVAYQNVRPDGSGSDLIYVNVASATPV